MKIHPPHIKNGQKGKLTGAAGGGLYNQVIKKAGPVIAGRFEKETSFFLTRSSFFPFSSLDCRAPPLMLRLVFHPDHF